MDTFNGRIQRLNVKARTPMMRGLYTKSSRFYLFDKLSLKPNSRSPLAL